MCDFQVRIKALISKHEESSLLEDPPSPPDHRSILHAPLGALLGARSRERV